MNAFSIKEKWKEAKKKLRLFKIEGIHQ